MGCASVCDDFGRAVFESRKENPAEKTLLEVYSSACASVAHVRFSLRNDGACVRRADFPSVNAFDRLEECLFWQFMGPYVVCVYDSRLVYDGASFSATDGVSRRRATEVFSAFVAFFCLHFSYGTESERREVWRVYSVRIHLAFLLFFGLCAPF